MATQAGLAEGHVVVIADQLDYVQKRFAGPQYSYNPQFSNTAGAPIYLNVSINPVTINIPGDQVFNMSQGFLNYTVTLPGVANRYIWCHDQMFREISTLQFYSGSQMYIVDIQNLQNYMDIVTKAELSEDEYLSMDPVLNEAGANNSPVNVVPALRNSNYLIVNTPNGPANPSSINYREPSYFRCGGLGADVTYKVQLDLNKIKNTFFACDKDFYFGEMTYVRIGFGGLNKICYFSDSSANPSAGTKESYTRGSAAGADGLPRITDLQLMLPVETNTDIIAMVKNKVQTVGMRYDIPYVQSWKNSNQGSNQTINIQFTAGLGRYLEKIYHAIYNNNEDLDTAYDHANNDTIAGVTNSDNFQKVYQYFTRLNGKRQEDLTIDCTYAGGYLDYMLARRHIKSSVLSNRNVFQYNWYHCSDYTNISLNKKVDEISDGTLIGGLEMTPTPITWSFNGTRTRNTNFQHYTYAVFVKKLICGPGVIVVE